MVYRMDIKKIESFAKDCLNGSHAPCVCACPFYLDIKGLNDRIAKGDFKGAYKLYSTQTVFPGIVSRICNEPCHNACFRSQKDDGISQKLLEQAIVKYIETITPVKYSFTNKEKSVAVIGAGVSGMSCALKLATKKYKVTIYEQSDKIGGKLKQLLPESVYMEEINNQFQFTDYILKLNTTIASLAGLAFDAVYVATGSMENDFGLKEGYDHHSFGTKQQGVFIGGEIVGATPVEAIAQGAIAAQSIEKYLKVGLMDGMPETFLRSCCELTESQIPFSEKAYAVAPDGEGYTKEEAREEAKRCLQCDCTTCMDTCEFMNSMHASPQKIVSDTVSTLFPAKNFISRTGRRVLTSCSLCSHCKSVCSKGIDMGKLLQEARFYLYENNAIPQTWNDFFLKDMEFSNSEAYLLCKAPGRVKTEYLFFPGCQLGGSNPEYVRKAYRYLLNHIPGTGVILGCCGVPAEWAGQKEKRDTILTDFKCKLEAMSNPVVITACPTCKKTLNRYLPEVETHSLYQIINEKGLPEEAWTSVHDVCIFDPCGSRGDGAEQSSIRMLVEKQGITVTEMSQHGDKALCCGNGGHIYGVNPSLAREIANRRIKESDLPYIVYCANCRDIFAFNKKQCAHILDILFGLDGWNREPPSLLKRKTNRILLRKSLLSEFWDEEPIMPNDHCDGIAIVIPEEIERRMTADLISEEDICRTVAHCLKTGSWIYDPKTGNNIGHCRIGLLTFWAVWRKEQDQFLIVNAYCHRLAIKSEY